MCHATVAYQNVFPLLISSFFFYTWRCSDYCLLCFTLFGSPYVFIIIIFSCYENSRVRCTRLNFYSWKISKVACNFSSLVKLKNVSMHYTRIKNKKTWACLKLTKVRTDESVSTVCYSRFCFQKSLLLIRNSCVSMKSSAL